MEVGAIQRIVGGLNGAGVRYLVVGGLAVNAHGYVRFTADVDLMLSLDKANVEKALGVFEALGYVPRAPVPQSEFQWRRNERSGGRAGG